MNHADLDELFAYDLWATNRVLDAAQRSGAAWQSLAGHGYGTVRALITHVADAQQIWLQRLEGAPVERPSADRFASVDEVRAHAAACNAALRNYLRAVTPEQLATGRTPAFTNPAGQQETQPITRVMMQLYTHGVHHRSECSELLSGAGFAPEQLDIIAYYRAHPA